MCAGIISYFMYRNLFHMTLNIYPYPTSQKIIGNMQDLFHDHGLSKRCIRQILCSDVVAMRYLSFMELHSKLCEPEHPWVEMNNSKG